MTDARHPLSAADLEAVSAYLAGDLPTEDVAAFEARLAADPALAAAADALADALTAFAGADDALTPEGFEQRLQQRLDDERRAAPADLAAYRERRRSRSRVWLGVGTAAAVLAAGALMSSAVLRNMGGSGGSAETAALDSAAQEESFSGAAAEGGSESAAATADDAAVAGPVILDDNAVVADEEALRKRYAALPEAAGVLGLGVADARPVADEYTAAVAARELLIERSSLSADEPAAGADGGTGDTDESGEAEAPSAAAPEAPRGDDPCLEAITADAKAPLVPVRVESLQYAGEDAIAYVLVTATPGAQALNRTEVWVVAPDCSTLVFQQY